MDREMTIIKNVQKSVPLVNDFAFERVRQALQCEDVLFNLGYLLGLADYELQKRYTHEQAIEISNILFNNIHQSLSRNSISKEPTK